MSGLTRRPDDYDANWCAICWGNGFTIQQAQPYVCEHCHGTGTDPHHQPKETTA